MVVQQVRGGTRPFIESSGGPRGQKFIRTPIGGRKMHEPFQNPAPARPALLRSTFRRRGPTGARLASELPGGRFRKIASNSLA
jgi:hypothetical protein